VPGGNGLAERLDAFVGWIAPEVAEVPGQHGADEIRYRMLRLADRKVNDRLARLDAGNQLAQPNEGRAALDRRSSERGRLALGGHRGHGL
jgi:hypothetical protein